ncbi:hypothetical protein IQ230_17115 [Gloeocapsopsis crepidinum LEGE 06123]|uniref:Uncharacterized protein n=1 Tax=Gloeocapsopsis crepidinum LEGE 06123 TaxID=588587 RepID=A0ABR9UWT5_9CHRO|nr:hypothetical protein [Gloeocapsopsis crepidinum]MBE9192040.1 hypothetical protein [Gloeocapsopsis crepidinum LEGE 06123]
MAIALSEASWDQLWTDWHHAYRAEATDESDWIIECLSQLAQGYQRNIKLRHGITLTQHNYQFHDDLMVINTQPQATSVHRRL